MRVLNKEQQTRLSYIDKLKITDSDLHKIRSRFFDCSLETAYVWFLGFKRYLEIHLINTDNLTLRVPSVGAMNVWKIIYEDHERYSNICNLSLGRFLEIESVPELKDEESIHDYWYTIAQTYLLECEIEHITPGVKTTYLFGIDADTNVKDGFLYGMPRDIQYGYANINILNLLEYLK